MTTNNHDLPVLHACYMPAVCPKNDVRTLQFADRRGTKKRYLKHSDSMAKESIERAPESSVRATSGLRIKNRPRRPTSWPRGRLRGADHDPWWRAGISEQRAWMRDPRDASVQQSLLQSLPPVSDLNVASREVANLSDPQRSALSSRNLAVRPWSAVHRLFP